MTYQSDLSGEQFQYIQDLLPKKKKTSSRKYTYHELFNAMLYVLVTGCQWRMLPNDLPKWKTVHHYFTTWSKLEVFDEMLKKNSQALRLQVGRAKYPTLLLTDTQSTKNADTPSKEDTGFDGGKKVKGIKKSILVDVLRISSKRRIYPNRYSKYWRKSILPKRF